MIIFDLDGTITLTGHREHLLAGDDTDWDAYYRASIYDEPNLPVIATLQALRRHHTDTRFEIWTGRSEIVRAETDDWLRRHKVEVMHMRMRGRDDHRPDVALKQQWLHEVSMDDMTIDLVFEDRDRMVHFWRKNGITCFQVAPGDF